MSGNNNQTLVWGGVGFTTSDEELKSNFAVLVEGNQIISTGNYQEIRQANPQATIIGGENFMVLPALVNSHEHGRPIGAVALGVSDDMLETWVHVLKSLPFLDPYLSAALSGLYMAQSGIGTVVHHHYVVDNCEHLLLDAEATIRGYRDAGLRVVFCPALIDQNWLVYYKQDAFVAGLPEDIQTIAKPYTDPPQMNLNDYLSSCDELFENYHDQHQNTVHISTSPVGGQWCSDELILALTDFSQARNLRVQMHLLETRFQRMYAYKRWNKSFLRHIDEIGALGSWLTCAHMVHPEPEDISLLAEHSVGVSHNPSSNLRLRSGIAPVVEMLEENMSLGIGLDDASLEDDQDYFREMYLAWKLANLHNKSSYFVTSKDILHIGTAGGANISMGANVPLGKLKPGYLADLTLLDLGSINGAWNPLTILTLETLLHYARRERVEYVMVNGKWIIENGQATGLNQNALETLLKQTLEQLDKDALIETRKEIGRLQPYLRSYYASWDTK